MPTVTVIIPNYNHARFLRRRIQSVLDQTYQDMEIIYLDDASQDNSAEVFQEFANHSLIRAKCNSENSGNTFIQWNRGVREAQGKYVWIAEADDYADPRLLERLVGKMEAHPDVGLAYCQSLRVDENDVIGPSMVDCTADLDATRWLSDFVSSGHEACGDLLHLNYIPNASAVLFRREKYIDAGYANEQMRICGDWMTYVRILLISDLAFVAEPLNYFRFHSNSVRSTTRALISIRESYEVQGEILKNVSIAPEVREQVLDGMCQYFVSHAVAKANGVTWRDLRATYRSGRRSDSLMRRRLLKKVLPTLLYRYGLLDQARAISHLVKRAARKNLST